MLVRETTPGVASLTGQRADSPVEESKLLTSEAKQKARAQHKLSSQRYKTKKKDGSHEQNRPLDLFQCPKYPLISPVILTQSLTLTSKDKNQLCLKI